MADRYFSPAEVEALIPALTEIMTELMAAHHEAAEARGRLQEQQRRITLTGGAILDADAWRTDRARLERVTAEIDKGLRDIASLGGTTKDLGMGLVDFPHLRDGREVNLCWRHGERHVGFWHPLDGGYAGRRPL